MAVTSTNALVAVSLNGGAAVNQLPNGLLGGPGGSTLVFSLQSLALVQRWEITLKSDNAALNGVSLTWEAGQANRLPLTLPLAPSLISYQSLVTDSSSSTASVSGQIQVFSVQGEIRASMFGAVGNGTSTQSFATGTDDTAAIQAMLDYQPAIPVDARSGVRCVLDSNKNKSTALSPPTTLYRITSPVQLNDTISGANEFSGDRLTAGAPSSGLLAYDFIGPAIVLGPCGLLTDSAQYVSDPSGSGLAMIQAGQIAQTTITIGSNNVALPTPIINVQSTLGFAFAGKIAVTTSLGLQYWVSYTGKTSTTFTGCSGGAGTMSTGFAVKQPWNPVYNMSDTRLGDLTGVTAFTFEAYINPGDSTAWMTANFPGSYTSSWFGSSGSIGNVATNESFYLTHQNNGGGAACQLVFTLKTTGGTYVVNTSATTDQTWAGQNTLNLVTVQWSASTNKLDLWINGTQTNAAGAVMSVATTGTLAQAWYESLTILSGRGATWPYRGYGTGTNQPAPPGLTFGLFRFSTVARNPSATNFIPPTPSQITNDANTRLLLTFDAAHRPTRQSMLAFNIGQTSQAFQGNSAQLPVWLLNYTNQVPYQHTGKVRRMAFQGIGEAIHTFCSLNSEVGEDCIVYSNDIGIIMDQFSYCSGIGAGFQTSLLGGSTSSHNYLSCEVLFGNGCQFMYSRERQQGSFGATNWGIISIAGDVTIHPRFPNSYKQGTYAFTQSCATIYMNGPSIVDDQSGGFGLCGVLFCPSAGPQNSSLLWNGGYIGMGISTTPIVLIGNADTSPCPVEINTTLFAGSGGAPLFSFRGTSTGDQKALWGGANASDTVPMLDTANPGPVFDKRRSASGDTSIAVTGNAAIPLNKCFYYYTLLTGSLGSAATLTQPCHIPGRKFRVRNTAGQNVTYTANTGSGVTIANGTTVDLWDNGTNIVQQ